MNEPDMFDALRARGIDADDPEVRAAVRGVIDAVDAIAARVDDDCARACMTAMHAALEHRMQHPDVADLTSFERDLDDEG